MLAGTGNELKIVFCSIKCLYIYIYIYIYIFFFKYRKALLVLNSSPKNETLPAELSVVVALPHVAYLSKSLKCSWANIH